MKLRLQPTYPSAFCVCWHSENVLTRPDHLDLGLPGIQNSKQYLPILVNYPASVFCCRHSRHLTPWSCVCCHLLLAHDFLCFMESLHVFSQCIISLLCYSWSTLLVPQEFLWPIICIRTDLFSKAPHSPLTGGLWDWLPAHGPRDMLSGGPSRDAESQDQDHVMSYAREATWDDLPSR